MGSRDESRHPIADTLVSQLNRLVRSKVVDLVAQTAGRRQAADLQRTVASQESLAGLSPIHAVYVYAQNQVSVMAEQLTALDELDGFSNLVSSAQDKYLPGGPPMSPLTHSFFTSWAFFDACVGAGEETLGTVIAAVGAASGMNAALLHVIGLMQASRMGLHVHEGFEGDLIVLRELVTDRVCRALTPSGYRGRNGELWYARVLPPPFPVATEHVVFTTPYVLVRPGKREWLAYLHTFLPDIPPEARLVSYERHLKIGPTRDYWNEFVFQTYSGHQSGAIFLEGLPKRGTARC